MTPTTFSGIWAAIAPAAGNHLWQSTLFAIAAGLLTMVLRKSQARARYWLWLAASLKFLIPFSLLIGLGSRLATHRVPAPAEAGFYSAMEQVGQPFGQAASRLNIAGVTAQVSPGWIDLLPMILATAWLCGMVVVLLVWFVRWRRISALVREAAPLPEGRELQALRRLEQLEVARRPLRVRQSEASLEPGVFGIFRPILLWPEGISQHLGDAHLEAILAHELWHVRRRDNLAAAVHIVVEAVFWFHPLVWWMGARLVEERERACDEGVLHLGNQRTVYAESILHVCKFCVGSPLACVSGVTGADLKKRMVRIMTERVTRKLDVTRKLLLSAAGLAAVAMPVVFGLLNTTQGRAQSQAASTVDSKFVYEVASIKPNKSGDNRIRLMVTPDSLSATGATPQMLIVSAYGIQDDHQISGAPDWLQSERYDIEAKMDSAIADELRKIDSDDQRRAARQHMLQALLADRFKLTIHRESKELPIYTLVIAKGGPKLPEAKPGDTYPNGFKGPEGRPGTGMMRGRDGHVTGQGVPLANLVGMLSRQLGRTVIDKTGLAGKYDFTLQWTPDESQGPMFKGADGGPQGSNSVAPPESAGPSLFTAIQEQLGLKLESQKGPVEIIVIDHVEKPSEN